MYIALYIFYHILLIAELCIYVVVFSLAHIMGCTVCVCFLLVTGNGAIHFESSTCEHGDCVPTVWHPAETPTQQRGVLATTRVHCTGMCLSALMLCVCVYLMCTSHLNSRSYSTSTVVCVL